MKCIHKGLCSKNRASTLIALGQIIIATALVGTFAWHYIIEGLFLHRDVWMETLFSIQSQILFIITGVLLITAPLGKRCNAWQQRAAIATSVYILLSFVPLGPHDIGLWVDDLFYHPLDLGHEILREHPTSSPVTRISILLILVALWVKHKFNKLELGLSIVGAAMSIQMISLLSFFITGSSVLHNKISLETVILALAFCTGYILRSTWRSPARYTLRQSNTKWMHLFAWNMMWIIPSALLGLALVFNPTFKPAAQFYFMSVGGTLFYYFILLRYNMKVAHERLKLDFASKKLYNLSVTDPMTGTVNRQGYAEYREQYRHTPTSVIVLDIDHFKQVNDRYGHDTGDHVIKTVASILRKSLRKNDPLIRLGGEEFLVMLPDTPIESARDIAETLRIRIQEMTIEERLTVEPITVSAGVSWYAGRNTEEHFSQAHTRADKALYVSKRNGRNRVTVLNKHSLDIAENFKRPILYGQEIIHIPSGKPLALELLARIPGVDPEVWFTTADTETIAALFNDQLAAARDVYKHSGLRPTINVDSDVWNTLDWQEIADYVGETRVGFEITHVKGLPKPDKVKEARKYLPSTSKLIFDDFEERHIDVIAQYPVQLVKIDKNYLHTNLKSACEAIEYIVSLDKRVVVEGIESGQEEIEQAVIAAGAEFIQGYKYHEPEELRKYTGIDDKRVNLSL